MNRLSFPNVVDGFLYDEMQQRFQQGLTVQIAFGGNSMQPMIDGAGDVIHLRQIVEGQSLQRGMVYMFAYDGRFVIHRLIRQKKDDLVFRGDNCRTCEKVSRSAVLAQLVAVEHSDGSIISCDSREWKRRSNCVRIKRTLKNTPYYLLNRDRRCWMRWVYFAVLIFLMWAPLGFVGVPLNNFVFGIRFDHLLHASVYIPCVFFLMDFRRLAYPEFRFRAWLAALLMAFTTETVQYFLPYRGFDINDMVSNFLGVSVGFVIMLLVKRNHPKISR